MRSVKLARIYGLAEPATGEIRYVGKSILAMTKRVSGHVQTARAGGSKTPSVEWMRRLLASGLRPRVIVLEVVDGRWQEAERRWISSLRACGARLLNVHPGGNGAHTRAALAPHFVGMLGKATDGDIALAAGVCRGTITYHRNRLEIPRCRTSRRSRSQFQPGCAAHNRIDIDPLSLKEIGIVSDRVIAKKLGLTRGVVRGRRKALGVTTCAPNTPVSGIAHHMAKLTPEIAAIIRSEYRIRDHEFGAKALAHRFGVHISTVTSVLANETWRVAC